MRQLFLLIPFLVFFSRGLFAQDTLHQFAQNTCQYKIDGSGKAYGIKMKLVIPCAWDSLNEERPFLIRSFSYHITDDKVLAAAVTILKTNYTPTKKELDTISMDVFFKQPSWGQFISSRKVNVDALKCTEAITFKIEELPQGTTYQEMLSYLIVYKNYFIVITYKSMATDEESSKSLFNRYVSLFRVLAAGTVLYNHWDIKS